MVTPQRFIAIASKPHAALAAELCEKIKASVYEYSDRIPLALAIGVIEIVKQEIMDDAK